MRYLLDTHVVLWLFAEPEKIPARVIEALEDSGNTVLVSVATAWEVANKIGNGKLGVSVDEFLGELKKQPFEILPVELRHVRELANLATIHRDPFDRILIAQAVVDQLVIISVDEKFGKYGVEVFW